ncbi:MAG: hypothetical protein M0D55_08405 [Elusimicrobiota bacterium]|nr:MAG: hypothetical protein M0D55_08405 [Elusimicrobiota bacterium]
MRLLALMSADKRDLAVLLGYTLSVGLVGLAVPLTAKAMVNTVASGALLQPLVVLSAALFLSLAFAGVLRALQLWMVETIQARLFARVALRLSERVSRAPCPPGRESTPPSRSTASSTFSTSRSPGRKYSWTAPPRACRF